MIPPQSPMAPVVPEPAAPDTGRGRNPGECDGSG
jgi:hypothetical protein